MHCPATCLWSMTCSILVVTEYGNGTVMPPRPQRMHSQSDTLSTRRGSTTSTNKAIPPKTRVKPKPVAMPSVPFMDSELLAILSIFFSHTCIPLCCLLWHKMQY